MTKTLEEAYSRILKENNNDPYVHSQEGAANLIQRSGKDITDSVKDLRARLEKTAGYSMETIRALDEFEKKLEGDVKHLVYQALNLGFGRPGAAVKSLKDLSLIHI